MTRKTALAGTLNDTMWQFAIALTIIAGLPLLIALSRIAFG